MSDSPRGDNPRAGAGAPRIVGLAAAVMLGVGVVAVALTVLGATNAPQPAGLERFATGELKTLQVVYGDDRVALPATPLIDADGAPTDLSQYRGQVVLVNLWADWCPPCLAELPSLNRLQQTLGSDAFAVAPVSLSRSVDAARDFYAEAELDALPFLHDETLFNMGRDLKVANAMPTTVLFGPDGFELARLPGAAEWDSPEALALIRQVIADSGLG